MAQQSVQERKHNEIFLPGSLLTEVQLDLKYQIGELIVPKVKVKGGIIVSGVSEKDFTRKNIPLYYYRMLLKNIDDANRMIKEDGISEQQVRESFVQVKKDFQKRLKERKKILSKSCQKT